MNKLYHEKYFFYKAGRVAYYLKMLEIYIKVHVFYLTKLTENNCMFFVFIFLRIHVGSFDKFETKFDHWNTL